MVKLLAPKHSGERLPHDVRLVGTDGSRNDSGVEFVGFRPPGRHHGIEPVAERCCLRPIRKHHCVGGDIRQAETDHSGSAGRHGDPIVGGGLRPHLLGIDRPVLTVDDVVIDSILDERRAVRDAEDSQSIRLVLGEEERGIALAVQEPFAEGPMGSPDYRPARGTGNLREGRPHRAGVPGPLVPEPQGRQDVEIGRVGAAVVNGDLDENVIDRRLGVLDEHVEVSVAAERTGVDQFVLVVGAAPLLTGVYQVGVWERRLGVLVEPLHVRMSGRAVEVKVVLLDVLPVVALGIGQPEQPLLQYRIGPVPQGEGKTEVLLVVRDAGQPILAPPIGSRPGLIVGEVVPGVSILAVVLADGSPLPLAQVRPPFPPWSLLLARLPQPSLFSVHERTRLDGLSEWPNGRLVALESPSWPSMRIWRVTCDWGCVRHSCP